MRLSALVLASVAPLLASASSAEPAQSRAGGLCTARQAVVFACDIGGKSVAVCVGGDGRAQYRAGRPGRIELASMPDGRGLSYANRAYSGGGESQVRFANGAYAYVVYSGVYRTGFGADGLNYPAFKSGLVVTLGGRTLSQRKCVQPEDAVLDLNLAAKHLPEGEFVEHD